MPQYVVQIQVEDNGLGIGWLAKSFEVTTEPGTRIPIDVPSNRVQVIMTNADSFEGIMEVYRKHTTAAKFSYDEMNEMINCTGAVTDSWPIN